MTKTNKILELNYILNKIASYLCYIDILSFSFTHRIIRRFVNPKDIDIKQIIFKRFKEKIGMNDANTIFDTIIQNENYISGSFILQCLYDKEWENSDIDIYCISKQKGFRCNYERNELCKECRSLYHDKINYCLKCRNIVFRFSELEKEHNLLRLLYKDCHISGRASLRGYKYLPLLDSYKLTNVNYNHKNDINYIIINKEIYTNIFKFISETFDLNICKVLFKDGKLYISNLNELIERETKVNFKKITKIYNIYKKRDNLYKKRDNIIRSDYDYKEILNYYGREKISNINIPEEIRISKTTALRKIRTRLKDRIKKYRKRGFKIIRV